MTSQGRMLFALIGTTPNETRLYLPSYTHAPLAVPPQPTQTEQTLIATHSGRSKTHHALHPRAHIESRTATSRLVARRPPHTWHRVLRLLTPRYRPADLHHRTPHGGNGLLQLHPLERPGSRLRRATGERLWVSTRLMKKSVPQGWGIGLRLPIAPPWGVH